MTCQTCVSSGRRGYCAPFRCYCGHETCHAFASYIPRRPNLTLVHAPAVPPRGTSAWDTREKPMDGQDSLLDLIDGGAA